jgi:hypothetical protein
MFKRAVLTGSEYCLNRVTEALLDSFGCFRTVFFVAGNGRKTSLEQFYTPAQAAQALTRFVLDTAGASADVEWVEPAAGSGAFIRL